MSQTPLAFRSTKRERATFRYDYEEEDGDAPRRPKKSVRAPDVQRPVRENDHEEEESDLPYGTPFQLDTTDGKVTDANKFVPVWKQEVTDEEGRRRFHGAFTGGFSAGYFNTVGTKEGWTPSTFRSSRQDRAKDRAKEQQSVEDFMDDEDRAMMREATTLQMKGHFSNAPQEEDQHAAWATQMASSGAAGLFSAEQLQAFTAPDDKGSIGTKLLKHMGWRENRRVGATSSGVLGQKHVPAHVQKEQEALARQKGHDAIIDAILQAQRDIDVVFFQRKQDRHGLGYEMSAEEAQRKAEMARAAASGAHRTQMHLQLEGEDDIYAQDDLSRYTIASSSNATAVSPVEDMPKPVFRKPAVTTTKGRDGKTTLVGFVFVAQTHQPEKWYPPPEVPPEYVPYHLFPDEEEEKSTQKVVERHVLSSETRGAMLGAETVKAPERSIFELLKPADRARLQQLASASAEATKKRTESAEVARHVPPQHQMADFLTELDVPTAQNALKGFMPFQNEEEKLHRYRCFLGMAAGQIERMAALDYPPSFTHSAQVAEWREFVAAAQIFRPMSSAMASRFTSSTASSREIGAKTVTGLMDATALREANAALNTTREEEEAKRRQEVSQSAANLGMFGTLTRTTEDWAPDRLLCRRFGVNDPWQSRTMSMSAASETKVTKDLSAHLEESLRASTSSAPITQSEVPTEQKIAPIARHADPFRHVAPDVQARELAIEKEIMKPRPELDLFKAIFGDDDEGGA